jgi:general secretion pathway protein G
MTEISTTNPLPVFASAAKQTMQRCGPWIASLRSQRRRRADEEGFTLVELMVAIVILGLLTTIVVINVLPSQDRAMVAKAKADIATIEQGLEMYRLNMMSYPSAGDGLQALVRPPASMPATSRYQPGGYLKKLPDDPWGRPYQYAVPGRSGAFDVYSFGADGVPGGDGDNADIGSWEG